MRSESVVIDIGRRESNCNYCKYGSGTRFSHGLRSNSMTVDHYQALLDRGWRRSGRLLYKPEMDKTCCPCYTIRLKASDFIPSKEQVRVSKRMQRFLGGTLDMKKSDSEVDEPSTSRGSHSDALNCPKRSSAIDSVVECENRDKSSKVMRSMSDHINQMIQLCLESGDLPSDIQYPNVSIKKVTPTKKKLQAEVSEGLLYSCNIAFLIAATLRRTKKNGDISAEKIAEILAIYSEKISEPRDLSIRACNGHINFYGAAKLENIVENSMVLTITKPSNTENRRIEKNLKRKNQDIQGQRRNFEIRLQQSSFDAEEYALYRKYQLQVHNDPPDKVTEGSYKRFLVDSPLIHVSPNNDVSAPPCGFGSFHQQYLLDGKLIAVGVVDILPKCLSSKYLFWDPDFAFLSLGKFSALEEIRFIRENQVHSPSLQYYYLGYYIHSCSKMRYKAAYRPSELLCPLRYQWVPYDIAKKLLDRNKYAVLSDFTQSGDSMPLDVIDNSVEEQQDEFIQEASDNVLREDDEMIELEYEDSDYESDSEASDSSIMESEDVDLSNILIGWNRTRLRFKDVRGAFDSTYRKFLENHLQNYAKVVGTELSEQMMAELQQALENPKSVLLVEQQELIVRAATLGLWANSMTVEHYQALLDRGWRRSGCFLYKPEMDNTCCPSYTIRLKASDFIPSKEQVRVSKRMQRFLDGTLDMKKSDNEVDEPSTSRGSPSDALNCPKSSSAVDVVVEYENSDKSNQVMRSMSDHINQTIQLCLESGVLPSDIQYPNASIKKVTPTKKKLQAEVSEGLLYSCNIAFLIAATLRRIKKNVEISPEKIAEILANYSEKIPEPRDLSIRACNGHINFYDAAKQENIVENSMVRSIAKSSNTENRCNEKNTAKKRQEIQGRRRNFEIRLQRSSFDYEEYALYRKYQIQVHNDTPDKVTESSYKGFLVDSPLIHVSPNNDVSAPPCGFGSFHQQYWVDGKLIAVGVVDILPKCLSSKYLFWDPDFAFLSLGKFSALEEIRFIRENQVHSPSLQYYYLGYYIHSCRKMRYKAAYRPSELLCPLRYQWVPYDIAKQLLDRNKYAVLSDFTSLQNRGSVPLDVMDNNVELQRDEIIQEASDNVFSEDDEMNELEYDFDDESDSEASDSPIMESEDVDLSNVLIGLKKTRLRFQDLLHALDSTQRKFYENKLLKYTKVVGTELSEQMVLALV